MRSECADRPGFVPSSVQFETRSGGLRCGAHPHARPLESARTSFASRAHASSHERIHGRRDLRPSRPEHAPDRQQISSLGTPRAENATMPPKKIAPYLVFAGDMRDKCRAELVAAGNPKPAMGDIAKRVGEKWKELDEETKQVRAPAPPASAPSRSNRAPPRRLLSGMETLIAPFAVHLPAGVQGQSRGYQRRGCARIRREGGGWRD